MTYKQIKQLEIALRVAVVIVLGTSFGVWQESIAAGIFAGLSSVIAITFLD